MKQGNMRLGALLLGIGLGILIVRAVPQLVPLWPLGLIAAGVMLWRHLGTPLARLLVITVSLTVGLAGSGLNVLPGFGIGPSRVVASHQSTGAQAQAWRDVRTVVVRNGVGDIVVEGGAAEPSVEVVYRRRMLLATGRPPASLQASYDAGSRTLTVVGVSDEWPLRQRRGLSARIEVRVPETVELQVLGDVGDVTASRLGAARIQVDVGEVVLEQVAGDVTVTSDVGDLEITEVGGSIEAVANVGDIELCFDTPVAAPIRAETDVGDITLELPENSDVTVRAVSNSRDFEGALEPGTGSERQLRWGSGAHEVELQNGVGEIAVERR